jgi:peptidoglycan hydrolase CwlO-like protein
VDTLHSQLETLRNQILEGNDAYQRATAREAQMQKRVEEMEEEGGILPAACGVTSLAVDQTPFL